MISHFRKESSLSDLLAGKAGTTIAPVSAIPAKSKSSSKRRLDGLDLESANMRTITDTHNRLLRGLSSALSSSSSSSPSSFDPLADYNTFGSPNLIVGDPALSSLSTINMIGCLTKQLRGRDVGLNSTFNPHKLPYVAVTDSKPCGDSGISQWVVSVTGPADLGDGTYDVLGTFVNYGTLMNVEFKNVVADSELQKSTVSISAANGIQIMLKCDYTDATKTDITFIFAGSMMGPGLQSSPISEYLHAQFNPTTFVGSVVASGSMGESSSFALDFNEKAINRRTIAPDNTHSDVCLDFSADKMMVSADQYNLFNAKDGSRRTQVMGYPGSFAIPGTKNIADIYIGYYGVSAGPLISDDGTKQVMSSDDVIAALVDGSQLTIQQPDGTELPNQKIQKVNSQM